MTWATSLLFKTNNTSEIYYARKQTDLPDFILPTTPCSLIGGIDSMVFIILYHYKLPLLSPDTFLLQLIPLNTGLFYSPMTRVVHSFPYLLSHNYDTLSLPFSPLEFFLHIHTNLVHLLTLSTAPQFTPISFSVIPKCPPHFNHSGSSTCSSLSNSCQCHLPQTAQSHAIS